MVTIQFVGDVFQPGVFPENALAGMGDLLRSADLTIGNLEMPMCGHLPPIAGKPQGAVTEHHSHPGSAPVLAACGFGGFSLANNHAMNYGWPGLAETISALDGAGIAHAGAGPTLRDAHEPGLASAGGLRLAILSYTTVYVRGLFEATATSGGVAVVQVDTLYEPPPRYFEVPGLPPAVRTIVSPGHLESLQRDVTQARTRADIVVTCFHWGRSGSDSVFLPYQSQLAHSAVDAGADIVVGHHPHRLQPFEIYRGRPIFYSLGNFCYAQPIGFFKRESCVAEIVADAAGLAGVRVYPVWVGENSYPELLDLSDQRAANIAGYLAIGSEAGAPARRGKCYEVALASSGAVPAG